MIAAKQRFRHRPDRGVQGDCHRTVLACLMELDVDSVPHFSQDNPSIETHTARIDDWLGARNLAQANMPMMGTLADVLASLAAGSPGVYIMLTGRTKGGLHHSVIVRNGQIIHDPSLDRRDYIAAPCRDGFWWATFLVVRDPAQYVSLCPVVKRNRFAEAWEFFCAMWW